MEWLRLSECLTSEPQCGGGRAQSPEGGCLFTQALAYRVHVNKEYQVKEPMSQSVERGGRGAGVRGGEQKAEGRRAGLGIEPSVDVEPSWVWVPTPRGRGGPVLRIRIRIPSADDVGIFYFFQ